MYNFALTHIFAATTYIQNCPTGGACEVGLPAVGAGKGALQTVLQLVFGTIAGVAVIVILVSVIRLLASVGAPEANARFRQAIIYAVLGLVIGLSAEIIVTFVLNF